MRAVRLRTGSVQVVEEAPPTPVDEVVVRVLRAGICATDLALRRGYLGFDGVPGHEFVGIACSGPLRERRVVGEINAGCGACDSCRTDAARHCRQRTVLGIAGRSGAFAELLALPQRNLHPVPDAVPTDFAVFAEPLAAACRIPQQVPIARGQRCLVAGDGKLGILCAHVLATHGAEVTVLGRHAERRDLLPSSATHALGRGGLQPFPLLVEASGRPETLASVLDLVEPRGTVVVKTTCERKSELDLAALVVPELRLVGSRCGPFAPALELLAGGRLPLPRMIAARYRLADAEQAFRAAAAPGALKVLFDLEE